jgi:hypothetical protein
MSTQTFSFVTPPHKDGCGMPLAPSVDMPKMRARKCFNPHAEAKRLREAVEQIAGTDCCFWACKGPNRPRAMVTCSRCWALRTLGAVLATLEKSITPPRVV